MNVAVLWSESRFAPQKVARCMKNKLHLKFFSGPIGLLLSKRERLSHDGDTVAKQILRAFRGAGISVLREDLVLKLRRFQLQGTNADGIFVSAPDKILGYFVYTSADMRSEDVEVHMRESIDMVSFLLTVSDGDFTQLFEKSVLPAFPELASSIAVRWTANEGETLLGYET